MGEEISRLMDGELEDEHLDVVWAQLRRSEGMATWNAYHVIGDALRGTTGAAPGFSPRFAARLAAEPTVLAPRTRPSRSLSLAWSVAATVAAVAVVGWVAVGTFDPPVTAVAKAREATVVRAAQIEPRRVPADYLFAHQESSPTVQIQGVDPYLRPAMAVSPEPTR